MVTGSDGREIKGGIHIEQFKNNRRIESYPDRDSGVCKCKVVNLDSGLLEVLGRGIEVERVNAKLVVED